MADRVTLDVIDRPAGGLRAAFRGFRARAAAGPPGLRAAFPLGTAHFSRRPYPRPTLRRVGFLAAWEEDADVEAGWAVLLGPLGHGARQHWHVDAEVARAAYTGPWNGWTPDVAGRRPLHGSEPALVLIAGDLRARHIPAFFNDAYKTVRQAEAHPGYLGGLALASTLRETTSCSCWRTYEDAKDYAYRSGAHEAAMKRDKADGRHSTEWFTRLRPLAERGSLDGGAPFAAVLREGAIAA